MATQNQLSRYGAISRGIPGDVLSPGSKLFIVADSDDTTIGPLNVGAEFPVDNDGVARVYTTIQAANNAAAAGRGDVIAVLPGYDHTLGRADSWNTAGVQIIGYGNGNNRPTIRYTATTDEVGIGASNIRVSNLRFLAAVDSCARALDLDTGFLGNRIDNCVFDFNATTNDFRVLLRLGSSRSVIENNRFITEADTAASGAAISFRGGAASYSTVRNNYIVGRFDTTGDSTNGAGAITQDTTDTADTNVNGITIENNMIVSTDTAVALLVRFSAGYNYRGCVLANNLFTTTDSTTADTSKIEMPNVAGGNQWNYIHNYIGGDSTEKLIGDSTVAAA